MLSNTAVPKYYAEFRDRVLAGKVPICREIEAEMNRIDSWIEDPDIYFDNQAVEGWVRFSENEMTLTDGSDLTLLPAFKLWGEQLFGWYIYEEISYWKPYEDGFRKGGEEVTELQLRRMINKQYLIVARGAAKSLYETLVQAYFLVVDRTTTHQITTAPTMKQAEEIMQPFRTAILRHRGSVFELLTMGSLQNTTGNRNLRQKLVSTKLGIQNFVTNSLLEIRPMTIAKLQGLRTKVNTVDEWLSGDIRENVISALEAGARKIPDWIILAVSSEGTIRNGVGDDIKAELSMILFGDYVNNRTSIFWYKLDDVKEVNRPELWEKAQPNLGKTVGWSDYAQEKERAEKVPSQRNDILAKRFGLPMEDYSFYFTYAETIPFTYRSYKGMMCAMGADLSQGDDFCAFTFLFPLGRGKFGVKTRSYITSLTLDKLPLTLRIRYQQFIDEGTLMIQEGHVLDIIQVYEDVERHIAEMGYDVRAMGYDPYNADKFVERWKIYNGEFTITKVIQGRRTETVPLGELKKLSLERKLFFDEDLMAFGFSNAITLEDINGQRMLAKRRNEEKVDNVAAMMDAYIAYKEHIEHFE